MSFSRWADVYSERARKYQNPLDVCEFYSGREHYSEEWFQQTANRIDEALNLQPRDRVLEVGCGCAVIMKHLLPRVAEFVGVDLSEGVLEIARRSLPGVAFHHASAAKLPFPDASFDKYFSYQSFHLFDTMDVGRAAIEEIRRVLRPGGRALIGQVPNADREEEYQQIRKSRSFQREQRVAHQLRWLWYPPSFFQQFAGQFSAIEIRQVATESDIASPFRMDVVLTV